jgi:hypothetical protein
MSSMPSVTNRTEPTSSEPAQPAPKRSFTFERFAAWSPPLTALCVLLGALGMAVHSGQLGWTVAGLAVYGMCLAIWLTVTILQGRQSGVLAVGPTSLKTQAATMEKEEPYRELLLFARFASWFLPLLAVLGLTVASCLAALAGQQTWLTAGTLSSSGCFLVWAGQLLRPFYGRSQSVLTSNLASVPAGSGTLARLRWVMLLLLSLLIMSAALWFATHAAETRWLTMTGVGFLAYLILIIAPTISATPPVPTGSGLILAVLPGVVMPAFTAGVASAIYFHRLSWVAGSVIGLCGCMMIWIVQIIEAAPKSTAPEVTPIPQQPMMPTLLLTALLVLLGFALYDREISALKAAMLAVLGGLALWFSWMFVSSVERDGPPQIESNWGGLGGGAGGWRCSASLMYALCALTFAVCAGVTFLEVQGANPTTGTTTSADSAATAGSSAARGSAPGNDGETIRSERDVASSANTNKPGPGANQNSK